MTNPKRLALVVALAWLCGGATGATAHAFLDHAAPAVGGSVREPPGRVKLWFSERIEGAFSTVQLLDDKGKQVETGVAAIDPDDAKVMVLPLPRLAAGRYRVKWHVLSVDTHVTEGDFTFMIVS